MVRVSPFPGIKYKVWALVWVFTWTMVWLSSRDVRSTGVLSGPTATVILSRYTLSHSFFQDLEGVAGESRYTPSKGPVAPTFSALKGGCRTLSCLLEGVAVQGVSQLHCRLSRHSGPLSWGSSRWMLVESKRGLSSQWWEGLPSWLPFPKPMTYVINA